MDTAVTKNGYFNLDVKKIWRAIVATSDAAPVPKPDIYPVRGSVGSGLF